MKTLRIVLLGVMSLVLLAWLGAVLSTYIRPQASFVRGNSYSFPRDTARYRRDHGGVPIEKQKFDIGGRVDSVTGKTIQYTP